MASEKWVSVVEEFFQKCFRDDIDEAVLSLDPDVTYDVPGSNPYAGHFEGPQAVAQHLSDLLSVTERTVNVLEWEDWMVGVNHLAVLVRFRFQRTGRVQTSRTVILVGMAHGDKIRSVEMFFDDEAAVNRILQ